MVPDFASAYNIAIRRRPEAQQVPMKKLLLLALLCATACAPTDSEMAEWEAMADEITITRDDWGIAHVHGPTDAHAVFGMIYAQAEDDFNRIEQNFLLSMGRLAEAEGEGEIWRDLRMRLFIDPVEMQEMYARSPAWLVALMDAWADGLNFYLATHPEVAPRVLDRFEPWMALTFSEGSIGGDIERVNLRQLEAFYEALPSALEAAATAAPDAPVMPLGRIAGTTTPATFRTQLDASLFAANEVVIERPLLDFVEPKGSNGFAIAPENTASGNALLLINPHTSFFFRSELHMSSDEGLNAYGAVTWGQFFIYQGFNEDAGWMHTSSGVDNIDEFLVTPSVEAGAVSYAYDGADVPMETREVTIRYSTAGGMQERVFTVYRTHHGPVVRTLDGQWVATALMEEPLSALQQSYGRTLARGLDDYTENMQMHTNSSNNTVYADSEGNIAYWHSNFVPERDDTFDWTLPVDGGTRATDWGEPHSIEETPNVFNPGVGWIQNTNNWPFSASGPDSPEQDDYERYFQRSGENARGIHAVRVLSGKTDFTLESLIAAAYDSEMPGFEPLIPALLAAYDRTPSASPVRAELTEAIDLLRGWDYRWAVESVATSVATYWAEDMQQRVAQAARTAGMNVNDFIAQSATPQQHLASLRSALDQLETEFGDWRTPWGEINRFQRLTADIVQPFNDAEPSIPVGFHSSRWGSLASFGARPYPGTVRRYGTSGNSFVAVVEFGDRVEALAVTAGGESGDPSSPHFNDQAQIYADGDLRPVYYYPEDIEAHAQETYHPGGR